MFDLLDDNMFMFSEVRSWSRNWESWMDDRMNDVDTSSSFSSDFSASLLDTVTFLLTGFSSFIISGSGTGVITFIDSLSAILNSFSEMFA